MARPYVDPLGRPCTLDEWLVYRRENPPVRRGSAMLVYVGIWWPDGSAPMPWHTESLGHPPAVLRLYARRPRDLRPHWKAAA